LFPTCEGGCWLLVSGAGEAVKRGKAFGYNRILLFFSTLK
jgi:hypothetical protein